MLRKVMLRDAVGLVIGHDLTKVVPGKSKEPVFRRGHVIKEEDLPELLSVGKEHVYVIELEEGEIHEEEAAIRIAKAIAGNNIEFSKPKEGRINLIAKTHGLLKINVPLLKAVNSLEEILVATLHNNTICHPGMIVAGTKIVPLYTTDVKLNEVETLCQTNGKIIVIKPIPKRKVGSVITGNEIYKGTIQDKFVAIIKRKCEALGSIIHHQIIVPDIADVIAQAVKEAKNKGCDIIVVCGGMSVDPDDVTVEGIKQSGAQIISYGAPVMPGAMFLYAILGGVPILGTPAAASYYHSTIFDLVLPRVLCGEKLNREDIVELGHGGLCLNCEQCTYPLCPFGK
ncbi:MAG: molybdopterin-binding protein [Dehalococcoidales bacterium]|nr:molybdopterin-binding protein [Dehalococcoidales bacterium]